MKNIIRHAHRHFKGHIRDHKHHYVFGIFGGFALFKLFLLLSGMSIFQSSLGTYAQITEGCTWTGQYYTGASLTGCIEVPETISGGYLINCQEIPGYWTGGYLNDDGEMVPQVRVAPSTTGCELTGYTIIPGYTTGCVWTGGYWTGGTLVCNQGQGGNIQEQRVCASGDIVWVSPSSGSWVKDKVEIAWIQSGCILSGSSLQLRDHNRQWITLASGSVIAGGTGGLTRYVFDSYQLVGSGFSGFYHIFGMFLDGQRYFVYTGQYTGVYTRFFTGYQLRLVAADGNVLSETEMFTIDNQAPLLTGLSLIASGKTGGYVGRGDRVMLSFLANEALSGEIITLGSGILPISSGVSGLTYTYTRTIGSSFSEGPLAAVMHIVDRAGNTGLLYFTSSLLVDLTYPSITGIEFAPFSQGVYANFLASEPVKVTFRYAQMESGGSTFITGITLGYLTAQQLVFSGIVSDRWYRFEANIADRAGNALVFSGKFMSVGGTQVVTEYAIRTFQSEEEMLTGTLAQLIAFFRAELEKFIACKTGLSYTSVPLSIRQMRFTLSIPDFTTLSFKKTINALTLSLVSALRYRHDLSQSDIRSIFDAFEDVLVVFKLVKDDGNVCKQNLSTYYINQFLMTLENYGVVLK